ncbi:hypothetical protein J3R82DRAFT_3056 [Butyriboletus roseoflavus]|nr:hypothetical protein J3R82DRAFT_3056 [Butyriboletus roseoflavus]
MRLTAISPFLAAVFVATGTLAQSPEAEPPESGSPITGTPAVTYPSSDAFIFCSAPDCTGTCEVAETSTVPSDDTHPAPNDLGFQSIYWYDPSGYNIQLYTCLNDCLVINPVEITEPNTCYNLYNNSIPTDFYTYYYF